MPKMVRKQLYIEARQEDLIKAKSKELNISEAELIRRGINATIVSATSVGKDLEAWESSKKFITRLMKKGRVEPGRKWRREELYDR